MEIFYYEINRSLIYQSNFVYTNLISKDIYISIKKFLNKSTNSISIDLCKLLNTHTIKYSAILSFIARE